MLQQKKYNMNFNDYFDRVFGCYLGKSIGGTFGAPYEGIKQKLDGITFDRKIIENILENDDLDLQVLFFEGVKSYGLNVNSYVLADLFYKKYPFSPGEYAYFKKNFERGINPPYSGSFNNDFYSEGMGCCIRGELWGCLFPANPALASHYAELDGCLDHSRESIISEFFISSIISLTFVMSDIKLIVENACAALPESRFKKMVIDVCCWCKEIENHFQIRDKIIQNYGHPDCTNVFQNNGIILIGLLKYFNNFVDMCEKTLACGFDTDCTVGICASIYGAVNGASAFKKLFGIDDVKLVLGIECNKYDNSVKQFALEIARYGAFFTKTNKDFFINDKPEDNFHFKHETMFSLEKYEPVLMPGNKTIVKIRLQNYPKDYMDQVSLDVPDRFRGKIISAGNDGIVEISCEMPNDGIYRDKNIFCLFVGDLSYRFGFYAPQLLYVSEPFFEMYYTIDMDSYSHYSEYFDSFKLSDDALRNYHLNYRADPQKEYLDIQALSSGEYEDFSSAYYIGDKIEISKLTPYQGPCVLYIVKELYSERAQSVRMIFGASDHMEVYINGKRIIYNDEPGYFTYEKFHIPTVELLEGRNVFVYKVVRQNNSAEYSAIITEQGQSMRFPKHKLGFIQKNAIRR